MSAMPPLPSTSNWWSRNWKWLVPVVVVTGMALIAAFIAAIFALVFGMMRSSEPYQTAMQRAQTNTQVSAALGQPLESGWFITGNIADSGAQGEANLAIPIHGPRGQARIFVEARQQYGQWHYDTLAVKLPGTDPPIDLRLPQDQEKSPAR